MGWHLKNAPTLDQWVQLSMFDRSIMIDEIKVRIETHNAQFEE